MDGLKQSVMVNQFAMVTGCSSDDAQTALKNTNWQLEIALSKFFQGATPPASIRQQQNPMCAPANTPATPPNFSEALLNFSKMSTNSAAASGGSNHHSPKENSHAFKAPQAFQGKPS
ncbi:hypothetical protein RvY_08188 [Ramazzottius varieornatus]|uniref:UBA-like domain-containing protein n=1 Tax=Ramazzottius varieornatus TaxID=947166 RepID=A0A1D1V7B8_RAMVA|nr:hypothetical protein RvY_08188 [Ramazzottius varieornatus]